MQPPPLRRGGPTLSVEAFTFDAKLENEETTLDAILASMARGALPRGTWERLYTAAQRDGRLSELAFAFEAVSQAKRIKALPPALAVEFLFQAACFFADSFGDEVGAVTYLERALAVGPSHAPSFIKIEHILHKMQQPKKLAEVCATVAQHRPRGEQPGLLRRAAELFASAGGVDDKVIELLQHVLRLEPSDEGTRAQLEALFVKANRMREVARLNEQALATEPPPNEAERKKVLLRIVEVYADKLHEPERAIPHVEQLLLLDPANDQGRKVAERLVAIKGLAGRAAAALANAHEALGTPQDVARYLAIELENTRGPKRAALLIRLATLRAERLEDEAGAFDALEQALAIDAADDDLRERYIALARKLGRYADVAKTLGRALSAVKSPAAKARAGAQLGEMLLRGGDAKRAITTLSSVLGAADAPADAILAAAYLLAEIHETEKDAQGLSDSLERVSSLEPDRDKRQKADERLAGLAVKLGDTPRAIAAYERLLSTSARATALASLAPLYEAGGNPEKHAQLLEEQAKDTPDPEQARERMMRAAEVRAKATSDVAAAIAACRTIVDRFGPARDVLGLLVPLLEAQRRWPDLGRALGEEVALTTGLERAQGLTRLGTVRMRRLNDVPGAIEAFGEALDLDANDKTARTMLEKFTVVGEHQLAAARILEPLYRRQGPDGSLLKMLELRGTLEPDVDDRLAALREAAQLADGVEAGRSTEVIGRALAEAVGHDRPLGEWLARLDDSSGPGSDAKTQAAMLAHAVGDREVTNEDLNTLTTRAAAAHAASGNARAAIALYRRALAFEPNSTGLLQRIDDLLRDQGSPKERIALYREALARSDAAKRKQLLHRIGAIQQADLKDVAAAIDTYRAAMDDDADDADAQTALGELYVQSERWDDLCALLETRLPRVQGAAMRAIRATLAEVAAAHGDELRARTQCARLLEDPELTREHLDAVSAAAQSLRDADMERAVLVRRAEMAQDVREQIAWLDRLGELDEQRRGDLGAAAAVWKRAASLAEAAGDDDVACRLYWRARKAAPEDRDIAARLTVLSERAERWRDLPDLYASLGGSSVSDAERVDLWLRTAHVLSERLGDTAGAARSAGAAFELAPSRADVLSAFELLSTTAGTVDAFAHAIDRALERLETTRGTEGEARAQLMLSKARVLATDGRRVDEAAHAYRAILDHKTIDRLHLAGALAGYDALVATDPSSPERRADQRWLLEWRAEHAPEEDRTARLLDWARAEETTFSDPVRALALYRRARAIDPEYDEALSGITRLGLLTGDTDEALFALRARRDRADGPARVGIELDMAQVLLSRTTRWPEALVALRAVLDEVPNDPVARTLVGQLLLHRSTRADAIRLLERACDATDDPTARSQILNRLLDAPGDGEDGTARRGWFERLCELEKAQGDPEAAMATAVRAARELPEVAELWDLAEGLARKLSHPEEMAALYEEVLARTLKTNQVRAIGERAVQFYEEWFEDQGRVVRVLERVLALDPAADWAFDRLKLLLDAAERWDDLFALYDRVLDSAPDRTRATLLEDAAQTAKDFADRPDRAIHYLEQLNALKPGDAKLTNALERLYERQGRHRELVTLLTDRLPTLAKDDAGRTRARVAVLWLDGLGDPATAFDVIEPVLQAAHDDATSVAADVWTLLERILAASTPTTEMRRSSVRPPRESERPPRSKRPRKSEAPPSGPVSVRQRAAAWLRDHYAQTGRDADLVRILLVALEAVKTTKERVRRHLQIAESYEKLGDAGNALEQVGLAAVLEPHDEGKRAKLGQLAEATGRLERFAELLTAAGDASNDEALRVALAMQAASLRADRIADSAGAIALLSSVLATPQLKDADLLAAGHKLEALLQAAGREEEQLDVIERVAAVEPSADAQRDALGRAARLAAQLGQDPRAIAFWEKRIASDEHDVEALDGLVELLERSGQVRRLTEVLELRAGVATNDDRRRADRVRVAKLLGDALDRPKDAIAAWRAIEHDFGEADDVSVALGTLLRATQRWKDLAKLLERRAEKASDGVARAELLGQLGDLHRVELETHSAAVETYALSLSANPNDAASRAGLLAIANQDGLRVSAVAVLVRALRASDDWRSLLELTAQRLLAASSDADKVVVLVEAAHISEHRANDPGMAFEAIRRAFLVAPGNEAVEHEMARLAELAATWARLVETYREAIDGVWQQDPLLAARLRSNAGAIQETRLDDPRAALATYLLVVENVGDVSAARAALRVAGRVAEWDVAAQVVVDVSRARASTAPDLLDMYGHAAEGAGAWDEATRAMARATASSGLGGVAARDIEARVAHWHLQGRSDPDAAQAALERALAHDDSDATLLVLLAELQRRHRGRPLVDTLLRLSSARGGDPTLLREAAEAARDSARDLSLARTILIDLLTLARAQWDPAYAEWAIESLARLYEEQGDERAVVDILTKGDAMPFDLEVRRGMRRRAARIALDRLSDEPLAIALYLALFAEDPRDQEAAERLALTYAKQGRTRDLLALRERQIDSTDEVADRIALRLAAAQLLVTLDERERAAEMLRVNLREDSRHEGTVEALTVVLEGGARESELRDLLVDQAEQAEGAGDATRAAERWRRAAILAEQRLHDDAAAEAYHSRVAALEPRAESLQALGRLATSRKDYAAAAGWHERLLQLVSADGLVDATLALAEALVSAGETTRATERLAQLLVEMPNAEPIRARLTALYREQGDWVRLATLIADAATHAADKPTRMARLLEAAGLFAERCEKPALAIPLLEQATDLTPNDQHTALALANALARTERFDDARVLLKSMVDAFGGRRPRERAPVHYQLARLELALGNRAQALVELDTAARVDPQNPDILRSLAELAREDGQLERAEKSYRALLVVLRRREEAGDAPSIARSEVLLELSAIARRQGEHERASEVLESALETATKGTYEQERLEAALRARGDHETLARVLESKLAIAPDVAVARKALDELAELLSDRLGRPEHALVVRLRLVSLDPSSDAAHEAALTLARTMAAARRYVDNVGAQVDQAIQAGDVTLACNLLVRLANVAEHDLNDDRRAASLYERAVELGLRLPDVLRALDQVFDRLGETEKQARVLAMRVEVETREGGPRAATDATYRLAALRLASRETFDEGAEMLRAALDLDPQIDRAEVALRRAVAIDRTHSLVLDLYERVGRQPGHEEALVDVLTARSELAGADVGTVREAVEVAVRIGNRTLAESLVERFIERETAATENVSNLPWAFDALANLRRAAGDLPKAVELKRSAARMADPEVARKLTFEVAHIAADEMADWALAAETYEELHRADPADRAAWEPLLAVYRQQGDPRKLAGFLASLVDFVDDTKIRAGLRLERVCAMRAYGLTDSEAAPLLREIVDEDASQVNAALMLAEILERTGASDELAALLARQIDSAKDRGDSASIVSLSMRLAARLEPIDRTQARDVYYGGLEWEPKSRELLDALSRLLDTDGDAAERADLLERRLAVEHGPEAEAMAMTLSAARMQLGDETGAERALELGYRAHPSSTALRDRLEAAFRGRSEWRKLAELCALDANARTVPEERISRLKEAAAILRSELRDPQSAAAMLRLAREASETSTGGAPADLTLLRDHVDLLIEAGDSAAALSELSMAIDRLTPDDPTRPALLAARANVQWSGGNAAAALEDMEAAFASDHQTYAPSLVSQLQSSAATALDAGDAAAARVSRLREAHVRPYANDTDGARAILLDLLKQDPKDCAALRTLGDLEASLGRWDAASAALKRLVGLEEADGTVETTLRLADACERAGRPGDARGALERARMVAPQDRDVRQRLERVYDQMGSWRELADLVLEDAHASGDVADRFQLLLRAGALLVERANDDAGSIEALEEARALRPQDPVCIALLADALMVSGRWQEVVALVEPVIASQKGRRARELAPLHYRLARAARYAGNTADELRSLVLALECDAQNGLICSDVALRAIEIDQFDLANRALRAITVLKKPGPISKALAYQHMGEVAQKQGDAKRALMLIHRALAEDPSLHGARALAEAIERGV